MPGDSPALSFVNVSKQYGPIRALTDINFEVVSGSVHALIGENGAGKSTCLGITSGRTVPTAGHVLVAGAQAPAGRPREMREAGVATIYQELTIAPNLTPSQNVFLGNFLSNWGVLDSTNMRKRYEELCDEIGVAAQPEVPSGQLSVAEQQVLEIIRGLASGARTLLFDEPTAALARPEREAFLSLVKRLRADGYTVVFVSHNLDEVLEISDRITVFREGRLVANLERAGVEKHELVHHMLGESKTAEMMEDVIEGGGHKVAKQSRSEILRVEDVTLPGVLAPISLSIRSGEILGIGGLVGSGRTEFLRCISGLEPASTGKMIVSGKEVSWPQSVIQARGHGIILIPEDRKHQGVIPLLSAAENIGVSRLRELIGSWVVSEKKMQLAAGEPAVNYGFDPGRLGSLAGTLSGGNQQKLLLARASTNKPRILLADEPTRGIDIGAKAEIIGSLRSLADQGCAVVFVSSELEEVVAISDRVAVLHEGHLAGELDAADTAITISGILNLAFGVENEESQRVAM
ncbi:sugar ABC transporter ATP-binding protein [Hoeflea sp.]|uniref:sugar ABC transporter ATP-binding protein n=1 Tax=Hoeflea sp. TaxID=1940281 RepID=UPI003B02CB87